MDDRSPLLTELTVLAGLASVAEGQEEGWTVEFDVELRGPTVSCVVDLAAWHPGVATARAEARPRPDWVVVIRREPDAAALRALGVPRLWVVGEEVVALAQAPEGWREVARFSPDAILAHACLL